VNSSRSAVHVAKPSSIHTGTVTAAPYCRS
jgi:hypothetical protein